MNRHHRVLPWLSLLLGILQAPAADLESFEGGLLRTPASLGRIAPRGWPLQLRWSSLDAAPTNNSVRILSESGPVGELSLPPKEPGAWWLSPEQTLAFSPGTVTARLGTSEVTWEFADEPQSLSREQSEEKELLHIRFALASGQPEAARARAESWLAREPMAYQPRVLLGDAFAALNRLPEALQAYQHVIRRTDWSDPPEGIVQRANQVRSRWFAAMAALEPTPPTNTPPSEPSFPSLQEQDAFYAADSAGQWAASATASSEYRTTGYSAAQATGTPDVPAYGDHAKAWASKTADGGEEWLEVTFARPVQAGAVRIRQVFNPGAVIRVEVLGPAVASTRVYQNTDTNVYAAGRIAWFIVSFPRTPHPVDRVRITLDSTRVRGWNEIDAVQLVEAPGDPAGTPPQITAAAVDATRTRFTLLWKSRAGAWYAVQRAPAVSGPWSTLVDAYPAATTGETTQFTETIGEASGGFYRVVALR